LTASLNFKRGTSLSGVGSQGLRVKYRGGGDREERKKNRRKEKGKARKVEESKK
jgi:hypothetical protein